MTVKTTRSSPGRPPGSKNKVPSKSAQAQAAFAAMVLPNLETYFLELHTIALDTAVPAATRIVAVRELLDRSMGKPATTVALIDASGDAQIEGETAAELVGLWVTTEGAPPISTEA